MYSVIEFQNEDGQTPEVEVVPHVWLERKEKIWYCHWPVAISTKEIRKAIEKCYLPEKMWNTYNCRVLHTYDSYDEARKKLVDAEFTSNLETDAELTKYQRPKRKLKRPFRFDSDSSDVEEKEVILNKMPALPKLRTPTKQTISPKHSTAPPAISSSRHSSNISNKYKSPSPRKINSPSCLSRNYSRDGLVKHNRLLSRTLSPVSSPKRSSSRCLPCNFVSTPKGTSSRKINSPQRSYGITTSTFDEPDFFGVIVKKLLGLENSMNLLLPMVKQLVTHFRLSKICHMDDVPKMPVDNDEQLEKLETFLDTKANFEYLVNSCSISGGTTISQMTRRTVERIMTNTYAKHFNWAGRAPKKAFKVLKIKDLIVATVKAVEPNAAVKVIENSMKDWLKSSSVRVTLEEARTLKNNMITNV